ncbi:MAG TPA: hypothetical protein VHW26_06460 [Solirubrobacteraceae bacterium]|nr:hypothetical protein [Solirubrobacteraceae bacterium]
MAGPDEVVERIRRSVALAAADGTARIRFTPRRPVDRSFDAVLADRSSPKPAGAFGLARRVLKRGLSVVPPSSTESGPAAGQIDFARDRSVYNAGTSWRLFGPGRDFTGRPGGWQAGEHAGIVLAEPHWLLGLVRGTVGAATAGTEWLRGTECRLYRAVADFHVAAAAATRPLAVPAGADQLDLSRLAIDVWLDDAGRIRRAEFHRPGLLMTLDLFEFGEPLPIEFPDQAEILADDRIPPADPPPLRSDPTHRPEGEDD